MSLFNALDGFFRNIDVESGGHQFDASGKPLRSEAGAIGVAQIMPSTGPEAARDAGLPWDPVKFEQDADYNQRLGEAYHAKLVRKYGGDRTKADAAYHSGPGTVDKLIASRGADWASGLGPRGKKYIAMIDGVNAGSGGSSMANGAGTSNPVLGADFLGSLAVSPATPDDPNAIISDEQAQAGSKQALGKVGDALTRSQAFFDKMDQAVQETQEQRRARMEGNVKAIESISNAQEAETADLVERTKPLLEARNKEAAQLFKLTQMNGLEKGIKSIFDPNYSEEHVARKLQVLDTALNTFGQNYQFASGLREQMLKHLDTIDSAHASLENLNMKELDETGQVIMKGIEVANQQLGYVNDEVATKGNLIKAHALNVDNYLSERSTAELTKLAGDAINNNGFIMADGVKLSLGDIRQRLTGALQQDFAIKSQKLALQSNEMQVADQAGAHWADHASLTQLQAAAAHGGEYNGIKVPLSVLTAQIADREHQHDLMAADIVQGDPVSQLQSSMRGAADDLQLYGTRMATVFGGQGLPREVAADWELTRQLGNQIVDAMKKAGPAGVSKEVAGAYVQQMTALRKRMADTVDAVATRYSGGDKETAGYLSSYLKGEKLDATAASEAMLHFLDSGGLPAQVRTTKSARAAFAAAQSAADNAVTQLTATKSTPDGCAGQSCETQSDSNCCTCCLQCGWAG
jgi:hypothetical protein